jgi:hypothetical protein
VNAVGEGTLDFDPRDIDSRDGDDFNIYDERWLDDPRDLDDRDRDLERDHDPRDHDPREPFIEGLELPHGLERELVQDDRENLYELNGEDSRMLATIGAFRVASELLCSWSHSWYSRLRSTSRTTRSMSAPSSRKRASMTR